MLALAATSDTLQPFDASLEGHEKLLLAVAAADTVAAASSFGRENLCGSVSSWKEGPQKALALLHWSALAAAVAAAQA